jgi:hypothetical protein
MLPLKEIIIGKADAINYYKSGDKDFLRKIYFNDEKFNEILKKDIYFLLGDKGTGKTAYAVNKANNEAETLRACLKFTNETDFKKFIRLIKDGRINVSDFVSIWKVILLLIISQEIKSNIQENYITKFFLLSKIDKAINLYYESAFAPEITNAIEIIDKAELFLNILNKVKSKNENVEKIERTGMQVHLLEIENEFRKALKGITLKKNFILFIDGTDQIPLDIRRGDYVECLRGLANAIWELNCFIFPEIISNNQLYLKIVLLIRPDIFSIIRFHNANAKLKDNSVILNWVTKKSAYKNSRLFKMADNLFSSQQSSKYALGYSWKEYCEENFELTYAGRLVKQPSFVAIMNRTFMRPRDIFALLDIMHRECINRNSSKITTHIFNDCQPKFARYLLGEIKDQFNFFYTDEDWQTLIDFFKYLDGRVRFNYEYFLSCYNRFLEDFPNDNPDIFDTPEVLLQELYAYNIICYIEESSDEDFYKWAYKEKNYTNLHPLVDYESEYMIHVGLMKAIGVGKALNRRRK